MDDKTHELTNYDAFSVKAPPPIAPSEIQTYRHILQGAELSQGKCSPAIGQPLPAPLPQVGWSARGPQPLTLSDNPDTAQPKRNQTMAIPSILVSSFEMTRCTFPSTQVEIGGMLKWLW